MTSSLVGSEMCIRDRSSPILMRSELRLNSTDLGPQKRCLFFNVLATKSVSYTHLTLPTICSV
eukprot:9611265-Prorocentrum_lima.AAC.1